jgi:hypothetical protein
MFMNIQFVEMKISKLINYSTNICGSSQGSIPPASGARFRKCPSPWALYYEFQKVLKEQ